MNNNIKSLKDFFAPLILFLKNLPNEFILYIKNNNNTSSLIPLLSFLENNPYIIIFSIIFSALFFSNFLLNLLLILIIIDSIMSSFFIIKKISLKKYSTKLSFNILYFIFLYLNPLNFVLTFLASIVLYIGYIEVINKIILHFIKFVTLYLFSYLPFLKKIYPEYKEFFDN